MSSSTRHDSADRRAADERLERLLDEELRAMTRAPEVDLRANVLAALGRGPDAASRVQWLLPRWALAVSAAVLVAFVVFLAWQRPESPARVAGARPSPLRSAPLGGQTPATLEQPAVSTVASATRPATPARRPRLRVPRPSASDAGENAVTLDSPAASTGPYLPGAPAGELGDPLQPMPPPPAITFAPIPSAPSISDIARPVTDFPADTPPPDASARTSGQSGGARR